MEKIDPARLVWIGFTTLWAGCLGYIAMWFVLLIFAAWNFTIAEKLVLPRHQWACTEHQDGGDGAISCVTWKRISP